MIKDNLVFKIVGMMIVCLDNVEEPIEMMDSYGSTIVGEFVRVFFLEVASFVSVICDMF